MSASVLPHRALERGAARRQRQVELVARAGEVFVQLRARGAQQFVVAARASPSPRGIGWRGAGTRSGAGPRRRRPAATGRPGCRYACSAIMPADPLRAVAAGAAIRTCGRGAWRSRKRWRHRIAPQVDHRVAAPWTPRFGARGQRLRAEARAVARAPRVAAPGLLPGTHRDGRAHAARCTARSTGRFRATPPSARRSPRACARRGSPPGPRSLRAPPPRTVSARARVRPIVAQVGVGQRLRCREQMFESCARTDAAMAGRSAAPAARRACAPRPR